MARTSASPSNVGGQHSFAMVPRADIPRSVFDRSCGLKSTFDSGFLVPILVDEALPGDSFTMRCSWIVRLTTPIFPVMDNLWCDVFFFAVPLRLLWSNFEKFMGAQANPGDSTDFLTPVLSDFTPAENGLFDYLGLRPGVVNSGVCSFWNRAYNLIYNEWFRDQNLINSAVVDVDDGPDAATDYVLRRRGKRHDYFTSCLPFPQKGDPVLLPLGSSAPVVASGALAVAKVGDATMFGNFNTAGGAGAVGARFTQGGVAWSAGDAQYKSGLLVDLSGATAATINAIREAFQVQRLLERDARGGTRYTEVVRSHFGVVSPDARLQRPEYLGGGSHRIVFHPVAKTSANTPPIANQVNAALGAFAVSQQDGYGFQKSFTEHCVILGLVNVRADLTYQQGVNRQFFRRTRFDYFWPALAHLGEQAVLNREIFIQGTGDDDDVFGYQERYAEYRYKPSMITGRFRSDAATPLDPWHLAQDFAALPLLNQAFIEENPPIARVVAVTSEPQLYGDFWFSYRCARPMPTFGVPGFVDHF